MSSPSSHQIRALGIPWYRREDWGRILETMVDAERLPQTYDDWLRKAEDLAKHTESQGTAVVKAYLEPEEFIGWCVLRDMEPDARARMRFANEAALKEHGKTH